MIARRPFLNSSNFSEESVGGADLKKCQFRTRFFLFRKGRYLNDVRTGRGGTQEADKNTEKLGDFDSDKGEGVPKLWMSFKYRP